MAGDDGEINEIDEIDDDADDDARPVLSAGCPWVARRLMMMTSVMMMMVCGYPGCSAPAAGDDDENDGKDEVPWWVNDESCK